MITCRPSSEGAGGDRSGEGVVVDVAGGLRAVDTGVGVSSLDFDDADGDEDGSGIRLG